MFLLAGAVCQLSHCLVGLGSVDARSKTTDQSTAEVFCSSHAPNSRHRAQRDPNRTLAACVKASDGSDAGCRRATRSARTSQFGDSVFMCSLADVASTRTLSFAIGSKHCFAE